MRWILTLVEDADLTALDVLCGTVCVLGIAFCWVITS
jgi:hypothetical protein